MQEAHHHRAFAVSVAWTLALLFVGGVVHATESSLACPDWPTCFGTMVPAMEGGVFWEHLHRLMAGALLLIFALATWLARRQAERSWVPALCWAGLAILLVQSVLGGLTVIFRLPDAISTSHLGLALLFLVVAVVLTAATSGRLEERPEPGAGVTALLAVGGTVTAGLVFVQSVLGGVVRHTDAGMACGRGMLCGGGIVPGSWTTLVTLNWLHRGLGLVAAVAVAALAAALVRRGAPTHVRRAAWVAVGFVIMQVGLGFLSAWTILAVAPVSLHTLTAAALLAVLVLLAAWGYLAPAQRPDPAAAAAAARRAASAA